MLKLIGFISTDAHANRNINLNNTDIIVNKTKDGTQNIQIITALSAPHIGIPIGTAYPSTVTLTTSNARLIFQ